MPRPSVLLNGQPRLSQVLIFASIFAAFDGVRMFNGTHPLLRISLGDPSSKPNSGSTTNSNSKSPLAAWQSRQTSPNPFLGPKPSSQSPASNSDSNLAPTSRPPSLVDYLTDSERKHLDRIEQELDALGVRASARSAARDALNAECEELQKRMAPEREGLQKKLDSEGEALVQRMHEFIEEHSRDEKALAKLQLETRALQKLGRERAKAELRRRGKEAAAKAVAAPRAGREKEKDKTKTAEELRRREKSAVSNASAWVSLNGVPIPRLEALIAPFTKKD